MKKVIFFLFCLLSAAYYSGAQTCTGMWGPPIVDQTFGEGQAGVNFYGPLSAYAPGVTTSTVFQMITPADNQSCLVHNATTGQPGSWCNITDHTGDLNGLMFEINAPSSGGTVFVEYTMHNLCPNTILKLSVWILNVDGGTPPQAPNMTMEVIDSVTNTVLGTVATGDVPFGCAWHNYSLIFNNGNSSIVTLKFINNSVGDGDGNDLALDDITVSPCVPITHISPLLDTTTCTGINIPFTVNVSGNAYSSPEYQWQYSSDMGATWINAFPADSTTTYDFTSFTPGTYWIRFLTGPAGFFGNSSCSAVSDTSIVTIGGIGSVVNPHFSNVQPDNCFLCNGVITLHGVVPGNSDTVSYQYNGITQPSLVSIAGSDSTITISGLCPGIYSGFTVKAQQCIAAIPGGDTLTIALPVSISQSVNPSACGVCDGSIILKGLPPNQATMVSYTFNGVAHSLSITAAADSTLTISGLCSGVYDSILVHAGVCFSVPLGPVTLSASPLIPGFTYAVHYGCDGDTVVFTNTSQYTGTVHYSWHFGDGAIGTTVNATHIYTYQDSFHVTLFITNNFCTDSITETVALIHPAIAGFTISGDTVCQGQPVTFTNTSIGASLSYLWSFGDGATDTVTNPVHTYYNTGLYHVLLTETDFVPCRDTASGSVYVDSVSPVYLVLSDSIICEGREVIFTGSYLKIGNTGITWNFGDGYTLTDVNPVQHVYDTSGIFTVTLFASYNACPDTAIKKNISVYPYPVVNIGRDTSLCPGQPPIILSNLATQLQTTDYINVWSTGDTAASISVSMPGTYWLTVSDDQGCSANDTMVLHPNCYLDIPNAFTPNGDGINDYFFPRQFLSGGLVSFSMEIYNRWGEKIFATTNINGRGWDGRFNNEAQPDGVYVYIIDATFKDGKVEHHQGNVTLIR